MLCAELSAGHSAESLTGWTFPFTKKSLVCIFLLILILEAVLFCWSFSAFFGSDSIFFFARRLEHPGQILSVLSSLDDRGHYRPLTLILFSYILYPLFKLNYVGHHLVPFFFHFANTLFVFGLLRRLLTHPLAVIAGSLYFGLHSINFFITYSITFLPDFTYAFFYLAAVLCFLLYEDTHRRRWLVFSLAAFVLSLLCKEAAATLPAILIVCTLARFRGSQTGHLGWRRTWKRIMPALSGHVVILIAYLCFLGFMKHGEFYPRDLQNPYRVSVSVSTLGAKMKYAWWVLNLPSGTGELKGHPRAMALIGKFIPQRALSRLGEISNLYVLPTRLPRLVLMLPLAALLLLGIRARWRTEPMIAAGILWFIIALSPVLLLAVKTMRHNLYIPLVGAAAVMGIAIQFGCTWIDKRRAGAAKAVSAGLFALFFASSGLAVHNGLKYSWPARAARVAENGLRDLQHMHPRLPANATLYLVDNNDEDIFFLFEGGNLFRLFYDIDKLNVLFQSRGHAVPENYSTDPRVFILAYYDAHLYDLTDHYRAEARDVRSHKLLEQYDSAMVSVNEQEPYPVKNYFGSPGNRPAFRYYLARGGECRPALVTLAGAGVRFVVPRISLDSKLLFGAGMVHDLGDGALGSIWLDRNGARELLYRCYLNPAQIPGDRRWFDEQVDLGRHAPGPITLYFECSSGPSGNTGADWFAWSGMKICCPNE